MADPLLTQFLSDRDLPCPGCGYNLRNLTSANCPECNQSLELAVRLTEPKQGWLIAGLVGLSAGAGLTGLLLLYGLIVILFVHGVGSGLGKFFIINGSGFLFFGPALYLWLRNWARLRRLSDRARRTLVVASWGAALTFVVIFAAAIR